MKYVLDEGEYAYDNTRGPYPHACQPLIPGFSFVHTGGKCAIGFLQISNRAGCPLPSSLCDSSSSFRSMLVIPTLTPATSSANSIMFPSFILYVAAHPQEVMPLPRLG